MNAKYNTETRDAPAGASSWERPTEPLPSSSPHHGLGQLLGLHPISSVTTLGVNAMMFGGMIVSMGALWLMALVVAIVLGYLTYRCQRSMYGDDHDAALVKALAVGLVTAIPVGLPAFLTVPSAVVGVVHSLRRKVN